MAQPGCGEGEDLPRDREPRIRHVRWDRLRPRWGWVLRLLRIDRRRPGGYYSFDVGAWHLIALNANCSQVACKAGSAQETWLKNDLATHPATCTLAFWHQPRFSAGPSTLANLLPFWNDLYAAHADVVLNGHKHNYQRLTKLDPSGKPDPNGIREWVVGTGGDDHSLGSKLFPGTEASDGKHFGILTMTLHPGSYDWQFIADNGTVIDSGSASCV